MHQTHPNGSLPAYSTYIVDQPKHDRSSEAPCLLGVLEGEGIGPEIIACALRVLAAVESVSDARFEIRRGGVIGKLAERIHGTALPPDVVRFCRDVFDRQGAVLAGAGGGRFVYDLRVEFDLFCKLSPLVPCRALRQAGALRPSFTEDVDVLIVRDNVEGTYQGHWSMHESESDGRFARHSLTYSEHRIRALMDVAAKIAARRRGRLAVVIKDAGLPTVSSLWRDCAREVTAGYDVATSFLDVDYAAYWLITQAREIDVVITSNLFGDVLSDLGAVLVGSRGLTYSGNFSRTGCAVYQTNHGAAYDLKGTDRANPAGQILSLAMLLRESFGLFREADLIVAALDAVWRAGWRTEDLAEPHTAPVGTQEMGDRVADAVVHLARQRTDDSVAAAD